MKQKLRKFKLLILSIFLGIVSCQPEEEIIEQGNYQNSFSVEKISENQFKQKDLKAFGKIELLKKNSSNNTQQRSISINNEFSVDTDEIIQISKGNQVSYTLPIHRTIDNGLVENLVITIRNNTYKTKIVTYTISEAEKEAIKNGILIDVSDKISVTNLENGNSIATNVMNRDANNCTDTKIEYERCCSGEHTSKDVAQGVVTCYCPNPPTGYTYTIVSVPCEEQDYGGGNGDGSTGTGLPNDEEPTNNEEEPVDNFEEDLTLPVIKNPTPPTPCDELKRNSDDTTFKIKMDSLNNNISGNKEKAFGIYNGNHTNPTYPNPTCGTIKDGTSQHTYPFPYHTSMKAIAHNHLEDSIHNHIGTFSPEDITALGDIIEKSIQYNSPIKKEEYTYYLTCKEGNYAIKITDINKLQVFTLVYKTNAIYQEKVKDFYKEKNVIHGKPKQVQNIGFLKFLKNFQLGIEYYEADENFENWKKLELNSSENDINKIPC